MDSSIMKNLFLQEKKLLKKQGRKESKMMKVCSKQLNVEIVNDPTNTWIIVWGLGLAMGTTKSFIHETFKYKINEIRMYFDKSITCVKFESIEGAVAAKLQYGGTELIVGQLIYIGYLKYEPPQEDTELILPFLRDRPRGLKLINDFITADEEKNIIGQIIPQELSNKGTGLKKRWVHHFGYEFRYGTNDVDLNSPLNDVMPESLANVISKLTTKKIVNENPQQVTVNHYSSGQGIPPHVDTHSAFEDPIISLSLLAPVVMDFRRRNERFSLILPPRSLLIMSGEARYDWTHGITNRTFDVIFDENFHGFNTLPRSLRVSLTFRVLNFSSVCNCSFPLLCDSQKGKISEDNATALENNLVHEVYEKIANHFSETRHTPWPRIKEFVTNLTPGSTLLDVGCGNGKYFGLNKDIVEVGTDMSLGLLMNCRTKNGNADTVKANALILPFKDCSIDAIICIAVLHHLATKERRLQAVMEMVRALRIGGKMLIYVWAKDQQRSDSTSCYAAKQEKRKAKPEEFHPSGETTSNDWSFIPIYNYEENFSNNDLLVPWVNSQAKEEVSVHHRYYHVFSEGELEKLILQLNPLQTIIDSYYDQGNWCVSVQKDH